MLLAAIGLATYAVVLAERQPGPSAGAPVVPEALAHGAEAPAFSLARLGGGPPVAYHPPTRQPVVVQFFASWCPDCLAELRAFAGAWRALGDQVRFVGVDANDSAPAEAQRLLQAAGDDYPTGVDPYASVASRYKVADLPATVFINPAGHVVNVAFGSQTTADLEHWASMAETG
jgi:thiol-disulfide isomerase/thioredoxin